MAKYLSYSGLQRVVNHIKSLLNGKVDKDGDKGLSTNDYTTTEKNKLSGIDAGAEVNVIESVSVNGTAQTVTEKGVDISVPTKVSDITNDSGYQTSAQVASAIAAATVDGGTFGSYGNAE